MKLGKIILGTFVLLSAGTFAQDECLRLQKVAQVARMEAKDYKTSSTYLLMAEVECDGLDQKTTDVLIASLRNTFNAATTAEEKAAYADTLEGAFQRAEARGMYQESNDFIRATNIIQMSKPDRSKANMLYKRAVAANGPKSNEAYLQYYYYNLYALYAVTPAEKQPELKKEMIEVYFSLSTMMSKAGMSAATQDAISEYFNAIVKSCDDILPDLKNFMQNLPKDPEAKKGTVNNFIALLEKKNCTEADEYFALIDTLVLLDPNSMETKIKQADGLLGRGKTSDAIGAYRDAKGMTSDAAMQQELTYKIAHAQYKSGSYTAAYNTAMSVSGEYRGKALIIAGNSVAKNVENCGVSTFERKCNYIYAVQLLQQAQAAGESVSGTIASLRAKFPTAEECFDNGSPSSVTLSCYGVSVNPC